MRVQEAEAVAVAGGEPARELVVALLAEVGRLRERVEELERVARRDSRNSSVAPSCDPPLSRQQRRQLAREQAKREQDRRKRGAQPGHQGSRRDPAEPEQLTGGPVDCLALRWRCGHSFSGVERRVGDPVCQQQCELPVIAAEVREWQRLRLECPCCGRALQRRDMHERPDDATTAVPRGLSGFGSSVRGRNAPPTLKPSS